MPGKTIKNKKSKSRIVLFQGSPVPIVVQENTKRGITYKLPANLLQPKDILRAKQKNRANAAKLEEETRRTRAIEAERARRERLESQARFAALVRAERERQAAQAPILLRAFENNNEGILAPPRRGPGVRGTGVAPRTIPSNLLRIMYGNVPLPPPRPPMAVSLLGNSSGSRTVRKANVLRAEQAAKKAAKPTGKFWSKGADSNSSNSD